MATITAGRTTAAGAASARQKKILIVGGVLLAVVLVIQVPRMMKTLGGNETAAPAAAPAPIAPAPGVPVVPTTPVVPAAPVAGPGKLVSFERFRSKDPFLQQVVGSTGGAAAETEPASPSESTSGTDSGSGEGATSPTSFQTSPSSTSDPAGPVTATISVNGKESTVSETKTFPSADPVFKLVSVGDNSVEIAIADGSFKEGGKTITLTAGEPLTLLNTADGKRYQLVLESTSG